jgi:glycosyltransferase involved in cell wall biosynthesis
MIDKKSNNLNILYISPTFVGGIGGHAFRVSEKLNQNGFDIELMKIPHIPIKNLKNPSFTIFGSIKSILNSKEYDIVHAWNIPSAFIMKKIKSKKKILSVHGVYGQQIEQIHSTIVSKIGKRAEEEAFKIANVFTTDSKYVQSFYKNKLNIDFVHLPAPLDTSKFQKFLDLKKKQNQVIYIGRNSFEKGIDVLKKIEKNIDGNVVYCTNLTWDETMKNLKKSTILVVPSRMESIPQVIKEAFFLKIPVIATNVGGIPELIEDGKTGILIQPDNTKLLLDEITKLLKNTDLQDKLSNNAYEFIIKNYTWESFLSKYVNFYKKLIE